MLRPQIDDRGALVAQCATVLQTASATYESSDTARWHRDEATDSL